MLYAFGLSTIYKMVDIEPVTFARKIIVIKSTSS